MQTTTVHSRMLTTLTILGSIVAVLPGAFACGGESCYGPLNTVEHVRHVKRMQPLALNATHGPKAPLEWGQVNCIHTTDTHGWLAGHLREQNYGADWGDFASFTQHMKQTAAGLGVDLLLVDTGDLFDGNGLSDASEVPGEESMPIFDKLDYDLMTIGNHELYVSEIAYQMFNKYSKKWGDRYLTSNVKIRNPQTGRYEYLGATHRYFTTPRGLRVMAFGVLFDFTVNSNATQIIKAQDMVKEDWFRDTLKEPIDLFVLLGHNSIRQSDPSSTFQTVVDAIRAVHDKTPIQILGGHTHIRDFTVYDDSTVAIESGRYCETVGWMSMSGFTASADGVFEGITNPRAVKNPSRPARDGSQSPFVFSRRYLDWNRRTFTYHAKQNEAAFDSPFGKQLTTNITKAREELKLNEAYGCAPQDWCLDCVPFTDEKNIFPGVIIPAAEAIMVDEKRKDKPRIIVGNTGSFRYDIPQGLFTASENYIVAPFRNPVRYIEDVPLDIADKIIEGLNAQHLEKRWASMPITRDDCVDPVLGQMGRRSVREARGVVRRQEAVVPGYATKDDWGTDGDDTEHSEIPKHELPECWEARGSFPTDGSKPDKVDLVFNNYVQERVLELLGGAYTEDMAKPFISDNFSLQDLLLPYAKLAWQENIENCPSG